MPDTVYRKLKKKIARILFLRTALKDILTTKKIATGASFTQDWFRHFSRVLPSRKFRENKALVKISDQWTVNDRAL